MNEKVIWDFLNSKTGNAYGTAAIMGNLMAESSLNPRNATNLKKTGYATVDQYIIATDDGVHDFAHDGVAFGLVQWCYYSRKQGLLEYAKATGRSVGDLEMQLEYLVKEMSEHYKTAWAAACQANDIRGASDVIMLKYENPSTKTEAAKQKRAAYGQKSSTSRRTPSLVLLICPPVELSRLSTMVARPSIRLSCISTMCSVCSATFSLSSLLKEFRRVMYS